MRSLAPTRLDPLATEETAGFEVIMAHHDTVIEAEDHVIVFVSNKRLLPQVEKLFQVGVGFF